MQEIRFFESIPYALPPVGYGRWKPAEPVLDYQIKDQASLTIPVCPQPQVNPKEGIYYQPLRPMNEDCLSLNIWAPDSTSEPLPVMVWIHGGSLVEGTASCEFYDGAELARKGIVVVTINYRLNVLGYFAYPELTLESQHQASGNYGITDQIQALIWVKENISDFGGDPGNVTIFGESAGALSVSHLLASPLAKGLFHKAILQSPYLPPLPKLTEAEQTGLAFARIVGKTLESEFIPNLKALREIPAETLVKIAFENGFYHTDRTAQAVLDGWVLPAQIYEIFEQGKQHDVPILVGFNSGETYSFVDIPNLLAPQPTNPRDYIQSVKNRYGDIADAYLALYPPDNLREAVFAPARDGFYGWAAERFAMMTEKVRSKAYFYYFDQVMPWAEKAGLGAFHGAEILYAFNNIKHYREKRLPNWPDEELTDSDLTMADTVSDYWVGFAKYGEPRVEGRPEWLPYDRTSRNYMAFRQGKAEPGNHLLPGMFELHEAIVRQRREAGYLSWGLTDIGLRAPENFREKISC